MQLELLIAKAAAIAGSEYKLAQTLGVPQPNVSNWKSGQKACPVDLRAVMAQIAGEDPEQELIEAISERLSEDRRSRLKQALEWRKLLVSSRRRTRRSGFFFACPG